MTMIGTTGLSDLQDRMQGELSARLAAHLKHLDWDADRLAAYQAERLRTLLARAIERSPFHASRLGHIDPARFEIADLGRLPTMTRADMMASFDDVVTDRRLSRRSVEGHLRSCGRQASLLLGDYVCLASGGSSGQRGVFVQTIGEYADFVASLMRRAPWSSAWWEPPHRCIPAGSRQPSLAAAPCSCCQCPPSCRSPMLSTASTPCSRPRCWDTRRSWRSSPPSSSPGG
jgi:hypothetical protein